MTDKPSLRALRELHEKATPGPWENCAWTGQCHKRHQHGGPSCKYDPVCLTGEYWEQHVSANGHEIIGSDESGPILSREDASFIAAARNALPALLAIAEAAIADRKAQEAVSMACLDDMDSEEAQAAFQQGHDADKALAAALALVEE